MPDDGVLYLRRLWVRHFFFIPLFFLICIYLQFPHFLNFSVLLVRTILHVDMRVKGVENDCSSIHI